MAVLPTRLVEWEFDAGVWTDVTADLVAVETDRGRNRELGAFETGTMVLTLRNDGRKYDPDNTAGAYYGKLRPNRRIRFRATYSAVTYPVIVGYVDRITQAYGGPNDAAAQVDLSDVFKLLNRAELPASAHASEVTIDAPTHWWRLGEPAGATAVSDSGSAPAAAGTASGVTFGTTSVPTREADTAATFPNTANNSIVIAGAGTARPLTVEMWFRATTSIVAGSIMYSQVDNTGGTVRELVVGLGAAGGKGFVGETSDPANSVVGTTSLTDGNPHHLAVTVSSTGLMTLYVDGVSEGTPVTSSVIGLAAGGTVYVGNRYSDTATYYFAGDLDEVAVYPSVLSAARIAAHSAAGHVAWRSDTPGARLGRILDVAAVPSADRNLDAGTTTLQASNVGGTALAYAQKVEETDLGELFVARDGKVRYISRDGLYTGTYLTSQATLVDADSGVGGVAYLAGGSADVAESVMVTRATVSRDGGVAVVFYDAAAKAEFGWLDDTHDGLLHDTDAYSLAYAEWIVSTHKTPSSRIGTLAVDLPADPATNYPAILALELGDRVTYKRKPQNTGAVISTDMRVERISHATGAGYWRTTLQLSPINLAASGQPVGVWDVSLWDQCVWGI